MERYDVARELTAAPVQTILVCLHHTNPRFGGVVSCGGVCTYTHIRGKREGDACVWLVRVINGHYAARGFELFFIDVATRPVLRYVVFL